MDGHVDIVVVNDETSETDRRDAIRQSSNEEALAAFDSGSLRVVCETEFWSSLGLIDSGSGIERLYTPAMLADCLQVSVVAIRHWHRRGHLHASHEVRRLPYFDFCELRVARKLAQLEAAGCSLSLIDRRLEELARLRPEVERPLANLAVVVEGKGLYVRHGENLIEPSGQLLIDFETLSETEDLDSEEAETVSLPLTRANLEAPQPLPPSADTLRTLATELDAEGERDRAIETYRAILVSGQFTAEDHFLLAELLYRAGDLAAARERYYTAIELDENYVEARANLGCVLAEMGEFSLAEAAFRGALEYHPDYADAYYHLALLLDRRGQTEEADAPWNQFLSLAPSSPWADQARARLQK